MVFITMSHLYVVVSTNDEKPHCRHRTYKGSRHHACGNTTASTRGVNNNLGCQRTETARRDDHIHCCTYHAHRNTPLLYYETEYTCAWRTSFDGAAFKSITHATYGIKSVRNRQLSTWRNKCTLERRHRNCKSKLSSWCTLSSQGVAIFSHHHAATDTPGHNHVERRQQTTCRDRHAHRVKAPKS